MSDYSLPRRSTDQSTMSQPSAIGLVILLLMFCFCICTLVYFDHSVTNFCEFFCWILSSEASPVTAACTFFRNFDFGTSLHYWNFEAKVFLLFLDVCNFHLIGNTNQEHPQWFYIFSLERVKFIISLVLNSGNFFEIIFLPGGFVYICFGMFLSSQWNLLWFNVNR